MISSGKSNSVKRRRFLLGTGAASIIALGGCTGQQSQEKTTSTSEAQGGGETQTKTPQEGGKITFDIRESLVALDFALNYDFTTGKVANNVWDGLMGYTYDPKPKVTKALAESVEQKSPTTYEYTIKDAKFHNGETITAADVKASYERIRNPDIGSPLGWALGNVKKGDEGISVVDEKTIQFNLKKATAVWKYMPAFIGIGPKSAIDEHGKDFGRIPGTTVGSGPFKVESWQQGSEIVLSKFDDYHDSELPKLDQVTFQVVPEGSTRVSDLKTGASDVIGKVPPQQWAAVKNMGNAQMKQGTTYLEYKLSLQNQREPWKTDKKLRKALAYATDWDKIIENVYFGHGVREKGPLPANMQWHNDNIEPYHYDTEKAKQMYEESGGIDRKIEFIAQSGTSGRVAVLVQSMWQNALPVEVNVAKMPYEQLLPRIKSGKYDVQLDGWGSDYPDPDGMLYSQYYSEFWPPQNNESWYKNEEVDQILTEARQTMDSGKREELYKKAQAIIHDDVPAIWGVVINKGFGVSNDLSFPQVTPMWYWQGMAARIGQK